MSTDFYWEQTFPAHKTVVIEHEYQPSVGKTNVVSFRLPEDRKEPSFKDYLNKYCMDSAFLAAVEKTGSPMATIPSWRTVSTLC